MSKIVTTEMFIKRASLVHGDKFNYDKFHYEGCNIKSIITCVKHGDFRQTPSNHIRYNGCPLCKKENLRSIRMASAEDVMRKIKEIHGNKYDYPSFEYRGHHEKITILCRDHGIFEQTAHDHLSGKGCPCCGNIIIGEKIRDAAKAKRPDLSHIKTPPGSRAVPVGTKGDYALVDEEDYDRIMEYNWSLSGNGAAHNDNVGYMHRFIINPQNNMVVDHINMRRLDNRKINLRECTDLQNKWNRVATKGSRSKYKGVCWDKRCKKWVASIGSNGKTIFLGRFEKEVDAALAYDKRAKEFHGEFANLNIPKHD